MSMILNLFRKSPAHDAAMNGYRSIVAQSRQPRFYAEWGVPDTVTGRFDMISLHLALVLRRLKSAADAKDYGQALVDLFFRDMDHSLREMGVTDLGVPPRVKKMGNLFYGLVEVLGEALDDGDTGAVEAVLVKNVYGGPNLGAAPLAGYLVAEAARLAGASLAEVTHPSGAVA
jgi:cytochrome b pre-mRNA-processing protein 3